MIKGMMQRLKPRQTGLGGDALHSGDGDGGVVSSGGASTAGELDGLALLGLLLTEAEITELMIDGAGRVSVERSGALEPAPIELSEYEVELFIERILMPLGLRADRSSPIVDARLSDGSRVNVVVPPLAIDGPSLCIRRFAENPVRLTSFGPPDMARILANLVADRANVVVVGPTSSGKTTLIGALSQLIDPVERLISIEDTAELRLHGSNVVRLEARPANSEGVGEVSLRRLVLNAMRMRPDRLVVGEVRGAEAFDLLLALTSGHRGCLTSCHAADGPSALRRLETLAALAGVPIGVDGIQELIYDGVDAVVTTARSGPRRQVTSIDLLLDGQLQNCWRLGPELLAVAA
ncbi:MAG: CpaF family protein [Acidimicrobiales bacterium]